MPRSCHGLYVGYTDLLLIAQAIFLLEYGQTETRLNALPHAGGCTAGVSNNNFMTIIQIDLC